MLKYLIQQGANVEARNDEKYTLLHLATDWGRISICR